MNQLKLQLMSIIICCNLYILLSLLQLFPEWHTHAGTDRQEELEKKFGPDSRRDQPKFQFSPLEYRYRYPEVTLPFPTAVN